MYGVHGNTTVALWFIDVAGIFSVPCQKIVLLCPTDLAEAERVSRFRNYFPLISLLTTVSLCRLPWSGSKRKSLIDRQTFRFLKT